jgi:hypothetical protein
MAQSSDPDVDAVMAGFDHPEAAADPDAAAVLAHLSNPTQEAASSESDSSKHASKALDIVKKHPFTTAIGLGENVLSGVTGGFGSLADAVTLSEPGTHDWTYRPRTEAGKQIADVAGEETANLGRLYDKAPRGDTPLGQTIKRYGPEAMGAVGTVSALGGLAKGIAGAHERVMAPQERVEPTIGSEPELSASGAPRAPVFEPEDIPGSPGVKVDTEPVEGGLPAKASTGRAEILQRVGLENARESALSGDAKAAATDYQLSKFDEPAGAAAKAQFDSERQALASHAENIVSKTGGTLGLDEDTVNTRGQTIAKPFDDLADWFDKKRQSLYDAADQRSGGNPIVQPASLQESLNEPSLKNQLTARGMSHLRDGIQSELERFNETNSGTWTVKQSEQFRQFLNSVWTPENSGIIGKLKGALDDDVLKGAGEDIYGPARQLTQMQKQTLENPNGIARLMERDPKTPINRTTSFDKIPDTLQRLSPDQFNQVIKTLDTMPEELQPAAKAAKAEIKAHLVNKVYEAGSKTQGQWNAPGVEKVVKANSAKLQSAFADQPEVLRDIQDLRSAGKILQTNQSYPGAAAQAANALKRGFMSRAISKVSATAGAGVGGFLGGPLGAAGGAAAGETVGSKLGQSMAERSAVKQWQSKITPLGPRPK